ncbi:hypothetical protein D1872_349010 [compost metagenome]
MVQRKAGFGHPVTSAMMVEVAEAVEAVALRPGLLRVCFTIFPPLLLVAKAAVVAMVP